jgi:hypothetical protein
MHNRTSRVKRATTISMFYGCDITLHILTSLAQNGEGLGTRGLLPETTARVLSDEAGYSQARAVSLEDPFNHLCEVRA